MKKDRKMEEMENTLQGQKIMQQRRINKEMTVSSHQLKMKYEEKK